MSRDELTKAISLACKVHYGQVDKGGQAYILHPIRVMQKFTKDNERIAAVLHDAVEEATPYLKTWIGQHETEPKSTLRSLMPERAESAIDKITCEKKFSQGQVLVKNPYYRFAWAKKPQGGQLFVAGETYSVSESAAGLLAMLADIPEITSRDWTELESNEELVDLLIGLIAEGAFYWD